MSYRQAGPSSGTRPTHRHQHATGPLSWFRGHRTSTIIEDKSVLFAAVAALIFFSGFSSAWYGADDFEYLRVLDTEPSLFSRAVKGRSSHPESRIPPTGR